MFFSLMFSPISFLRERKLAILTLIRFQLEVDSVHMPLELAVSVKQFPAVRTDYSVTMVTSSYRPGEMRLQRVSWGEGFRGS